MQDNFVHHYTFTHQSSHDSEASSFPIQSVSSKTVAISDNTTWRTALREFANFMSGIYGYNITEQVFIQDIGWEGEADYVPLTDADVV